MNINELRSAKDKGTVLFIFLCKFCANNIGFAKIDLARSLKVQDGKNRKVKQSSFDIRTKNQSKIHCKQF